MSTTFEPAETGADALSSAGIAAWVEQLADVDMNASDAELIDRITQLERLKSACSAAQAVFTMTFVESQTDGLPAAKNEYIGASPRRSRWRERIRRSGVAGTWDWRKR